MEGWDEGDDVVKDTESLEGKPSKEGPGEKDRPKLSYV